MIAFFMYWSLAGGVSMLLCFTTYWDITLYIPACMATGHGHSLYLKCCCRLVSRLSISHFNVTLNSHQFPMVFQVCYIGCSNTWELFGDSNTKSTPNMIFSKKRICIYCCTKAPTTTKTWFKHQKRLVTSLFVFVSFEFLFSSLTL